MDKDQRIIDLYKFKKDDYKIIRGLNAKGYSVEEIATMMGTTKDHVWGLLPVEQKLSSEDWTSK